jgi:anti-anti-sigma regulatory factor
LALGLGNDELDCLYSMFLGKLVATRRLILENGGHMHLCEVGPASLSVLTTCKLDELFEIHPDMGAAVKALEALD